MMQSVLARRVAASLLLVCVAGCGTESGSVVDAAPANEAVPSGEPSQTGGWACDTESATEFVGRPAEPIPGASLTETAASLPFADDFEATQSGRTGVVTWRDASGVISRQYEYRRDEKGWWLDGGRSCDGVT